MTEIIHTVRAQEDLEQIWQFIALDSERAAEKLLLDIDRKIERLKDFPESGMLREDIGAEIRILVHGRYLVLYEFDAADDRVEIVAVVDGARNLANFA